MKKGEPGAVEVSHLTVSFSRWGQSVAAINDVSFVVPSGEWLLLVGPNGAGKSTILRVLAGYIVPDTGKVRVSGGRVDNLRPSQVARTVFLVHQDPLLGTAPLLTVFENLFVADTAAIRTGRSKQRLRHSYAELLALVGLEHRMDQPVKLLSGGERQLLAMTIATLREAKVILLDEPLAALDAVKMKLCIDQIERMHRDGKTVIQVAHDTHLLTRLADRVLMLDRGRIAAEKSLSAPPELSAP